MGETRRETVANTALLRCMIDKSPKLKFKCFYDAMVCGDEKRRAETSSGNKTIRVEQEVCLIETALKFITYYHQADSHDELMRFVAESLKCVYFVAMSFVTILEQASSCIRDTNGFTAVMLTKYPRCILVESEDTRMQYIRKHALRISAEKHDELLAATTEPPDQEGTGIESRVLSQSVIQEAWL